MAMRIGLVGIVLVIAGVVGFTLGGLVWLGQLGSFFTLLPRDGLLVSYYGLIWGPILGAIGGILLMASEARRVTKVA